MSTDIQCSLKRKDEEVPEAGQGPSKKIKSKMTCNQTAVAVLQELCMKRKWSPPKYEVHDVTGPSNEPIFDVSVTLCNGIKGIGRGRQKRSAKHDAAQKALDQIQLRALPDADGSDISKTPSSNKE